MTANDTNDTNTHDPKSGHTDNAASDASDASAKRERPTPEGDGLDPTRYGDWEKNGRCIDF